MTGAVAVLFPFLRRQKGSTLWNRVTRDEAYQLFVILNELLLGVETTLAHASSGTIRPYEWVPIIFGPIAGLGLAAAYVARRRGQRWGGILTLLLMVASCIVGMMGTGLHLARSLRPAPYGGMREVIGLLVWGVPLLAPPSFALVGALGVVTLLDTAQELKDHLYFLLSSVGVAIAAVSSVLDHLRGGFDNPWLWVPTIAGIFGTVAAFTIGVLPHRSRGDLTIYALSMVSLVLVGPLGSVLHLYHDLGAGNVLVIERLLRGAPILAPMVFANMGLMGLLALLGDGPAQEWA